MKKVLVSLLLMALFPLSRVYAESSQVGLQSEYVDSSNPHNGQHRSPLNVPEVWIDDYTLLFMTPCDGCVVRLLDESGEVAYTTVISSTSLVLPSHLSGNYRIEIIRGNFCFWGYINL